jgi:hypothetical protein
MEAMTEETVRERRMLTHRHETRMNKTREDRATDLHVADDAAAGVVEELNADLDATTLGTSASEDLGDLRGCEHDSK